MSSDLTSDGMLSTSSTIIREVYLSKEIQKRAKEFTENKKLTVFVGTWNVNAKKPTEDLAPWLIGSTGELADVYCVGFQEIVDLNAGNLLVDHNRGALWEDKIEVTLKQQYKQVASKHLVGLSLCVYVKRALYVEVSDVSSESVGVGFAGIGGNKGACGIRFNLFNSSLCFINSHLAAHQHNSVGRNSDYQNICARLAFQSSNSKLQKNTKYTLFEHDHLFWLGDLNYRISMDILDVYRRIDMNDWAGLLQQDQLIIEKSKGNAFKYFKEGQIDFAPTYKYQPGTSAYERRDDKKKRIPAWCDRIQWIGEEIVQLEYDRCESLRISDHKPVFARFEISVKEVIQDRKRIVYESLIRQLDSWENQAIPKVEISPTSLDFGLVKYDEMKERKLVIENTGTVTVVEFHFVPKVAIESASSSSSNSNNGLTKGGVTLPSINTSGKKWLKVSPEFGIIPPQQSCEITLSMHITSDDCVAHSIQTGAEPLEDILILTLENGRDYFIPVQGEYQKSCLGTTIEYLVNTPTPVRTTLPTKEPSSVLSLPKEIWRMVDFIFRNGISDPELFVTSGEKQEIDRICENLDLGTEFEPTYQIHSMAEALIYFLKSLAEPIFPPSLVEQYVDGSNLTTFCKQALLLLTPAHYNSFIYLISFLRECLKHASSNHLTPTQLVLVFAGCIMHCQVDALDTGSSGSNHSSSEQPTSPPLSTTTSPGSTNTTTTKNPKAWVILRHYLTSEEFV